MRRPWSSKTWSPSRSVSNASAYWKPEQPPPRTPTRRPEVWIWAPWPARNSCTFSAPFSVKVIIASERIAPATLCVVPTTDELKERIESAIPGARVEVTDLTGGGDHFRASVSPPGFAGLSRVEQHRPVYAGFGA